MTSGFATGWLGGTVLRGRALGAVALMAAAAALAGCKETHSAPEVEARPVRVVTVALEPASDTVRYPAVIRPRVEADVGFRVAGKVVARLVEVGTRVEPGMALARLDPADIELQVRATQAQLASARADAANARADFSRYSQLRQGEWTTRQEFDRRRTALDKAEARVREIEAQLHVLTNSLQYTSLIADAPGIVTATLIEPGQVVAQGQAAFRVARLGSVEAVANIPEQQVATLPQRRLSVELWANPGAPIAGTLRELSPSADPGTRTYQARVTLIDPPPLVQLGMTATLIARQERAGVIARLPMTAITQKDQQPAVWVVSPGAERLELRPVAIAAYAGDLAIVSEGLKEGERVVTAGVHKLDAGQKVRVWTEPGK
ncbi:efflux RND transporter periplasmic adaptor subunit [Azospirillum thermophilum]|uniref:Efflux RND transporter periplasmic adaptor subunit n=1 Tax=Azospirillum thermophilum TaxID=2202148 RepID=A0A2S2CWT9_9PROT|nr:efflux RND transporter periplasmic adaptor subunit [Azospirillum thermophilum]AWK88939.1 efflux RND transporter periplasmic adaptor subunit [Azospirillum thermophilum]